MVALESGNRDVARVPASVTVAAGSTTGTFTVDTSTVTVTTNVTLQATYAGVTKTTNLAVTTPTPRAVFTVTSPSRGANACQLTEDAGLVEFDCTLDGTASEGALTRWSWEIATSSNRLTENRADGVLIPDIPNGCGFFSDASSSTDINGNRFIDLTIRLQVTDRQGRNSDVTPKSVKLYPDHKCGKDF